MNNVQLAAMLQLQYKMNAKVNADWVNAGYDWHRAIVVEGGEAIEHHGWKWWKKQAMDVPQLQIELVDIWHFALSHVIVTQRGHMDETMLVIQNNLTSAYQRAGVTFDATYFSFAHMTMLERLELMVGLAVNKRFSFALFETLLADVGMTWDGLYAMYVSKNVLNFFRQDHGYKDGTYRKHWHDGREDNEHLYEIANTLKKDDMFQHSLYDALADRYRMVAGDAPETVLTNPV